MTEVISARQRARLPVETLTLIDLAHQYKQKIDSISPEGIQQIKKLTRLEAGQILLSMKRRVDAGEGGMKWWPYFTKHIREPKYSRSNAEKLLKIAEAPDPQAYDAEKAANNTRMQAKRAAAAATRGSVLRKNAETPTRVMDVKGRVAAPVEGTATVDRCESCPRMIKLKEWITTKHGPLAWGELFS